MTTKESDQAVYPSESHRKHMEIHGVYYPLILHFARISAYHHAHTVGTYDICVMDNIGCQCSIVEKSPWEGSKMGG